MRVCTNAHSIHISSSRSVDENRLSPTFVRPLKIARSCRGCAPGAAPSPRATMSTRSCAGATSPAPSRRTGTTGGLTTRRRRGASRAVWKSKFYGAFVPNRRVVLHAIDATPARWRGDAGSSPLDRARTAAPSPRGDLVKNCRVHPTHWLISTQARRLDRDLCRGDRGARRPETQMDLGAAQEKASTTHGRVVHRVHRE